MKKGYTITELLVAVVFLVLFVGGGIGWIKNAIDLVKCDFKAPYKAEIIRGIGLVTPISAITGYMKIEDK